jgi:hypothetical protein
MPGRDSIEFAAAFTLGAILGVGITLLLGSDIPPRVRSARGGREGATDSDRVHPAVSRVVEEVSRQTRFSARGVLASARREAARILRAVGEELVRSDRGPVR